MHADIPLLRQLPLFSGIAPDELSSLLHCVGARKESFAKGAFISLDGDSTQSIGIVLRGGVQIIKEDVFGNRTILNDLAPGSVFGESFVCGGRFSLSVSVQATRPCQVLFLPFNRIMTLCPGACGFHNTLVRNMVILLAHKNMALLARLEVATKPTLREKVLTYLSHLAQEQASPSVVSALGRVDLADYLGANRSALTRELNRMRSEGLIDFSKNTYTLLEGAHIPALPRKA